MEVRKKRYAEKIEHIELRKTNIEEWSEDILRDEKTKLASYKAMQEIIECCMDLLCMLLKDEKHIIKDDYSNILLAERVGLLNSNLADLLRELNGLRNRIVHEYNGLNDEIAKESILELLPGVDDFVKWVKEWLKRK